MKMKFTWVIEGEEVIENKFHHAVKNNPNLHMDLIQAIGQIMVIGFGFKKEDNISVVSFTVGKVGENEKDSTSSLEPLKQKN